MAHITPPQFYPVLEENGSAYHMVLGQTLITDWHVRDFVKSVQCRGHFVIVDNGAAEPEEERVPFDKIATAALIMGVDEIVLPDVLRDGPETYKLTTQYADIVPIRNRVVIPQGDTWIEWQRCLDMLCDKIAFRTIGVPKHLERLQGGREYALRVLEFTGLSERYDVHLFGIWERPLEELELCRKFPWVRGIDSGAAVAYAQHGCRVSNEVHHSLDWNGNVRYQSRIAGNMILMNEIARRRT